MKKLNVYNVYLDDNGDCLRITVPAESRKAAEDYCNGNGEVIATKMSDLQDINLDYLADTLRRCAWGQQVIDVITRTLDLCGLRRESWNPCCSCHRRAHRIWATAADAYPWQARR